MLTEIRRFVQSESMGGVALGLAALAALLVSNSAFAPAYDRFIHLPGEVRIGDLLSLKKPLIVWVNDLWMAVFFFLVGLEIKREVVDGELSQLRQALLPLAAALGGMLVPAGVYVAINWGDAIALRGWAIPAATDIAFALGVLMLLGSRVPASLKVFVTAVAIIDDLGAIVVIALFYTDQLSSTMLVAAAIGLAVLALMNRARVMAIGPYVVVGLLIWLAVLKSGVHATMAGVLTALFIPIRCGGENSPLHTAEHALQPWVAYAVLPMFAFVNAGVSLQGVTPALLTQGVPLGITLGLVVGKVLGVGLGSTIVFKFAGAQMPAGASLRQFLGVCALCGIGFTMSLFIGSLAFVDQDAAYEVQLKLGVLVGSLLSMVVGVGLLWRRPGD